MIWPSSPAPAPARTHSFPPLPQGFVSTFPPAAVEPASPPSEPPEPIEPILEARETTRSIPPLPPSRRSSASYPAPPSARRPPSAIDEPFATPSFPPPNVSVPLAPPSPDISPSINVAPGAGPSMLPPMPSSADELEEMELRPSFIGRLKRLFGKKRPDEL
jgi:hypothetical protein